MGSEGSFIERVDRSGAAGGVAAQLPPHRFTQDAFFRMLDAGILHPEDRVELIDGEIVDMTPSGPQHAEYVDRLLHLFANVMAETRVRVQGSLDLGPATLVDPDFMLLRPKPEGYVDALPTGEDVLLVVEVADASLVRDRQVKARLYAAAGIGDYWIVEVERQVIVVHRDPQADRYDQIETIKGSKAVAPLHLPHKRVTPAELFV